MRPAPYEREQIQVQLSHANWTEVRIPRNPKVFANYMTAMAKYCDDTFGPGRMEPTPNMWMDGYDVWYSFTWYGYCNFFFRHEQDATAFTLRWL